MKAVNFHESISAPDFSRLNPVEDLQRKSAGKAKAPAKAKAKAPAKAKAKAPAKAKAKAPAKAKAKAPAKIKTAKAKVVTDQGAANGAASPATEPKA